MSYRCWLDKTELVREQSRVWAAAGSQGKLVSRGDIQKVAEGQEGSRHGNIWDKSGPGRGNSQCQDPKAGAVDKFMEHGRGQGSWAGWGEGKKWETRALSWDQPRRRAILNTEMDFTVR